MLPPGVTQVTNQETRTSMSKRLSCSPVFKHFRSENQVASFSMSATKVNRLQSVTGEALVSLQESRGLIAMICAVAATGAALLSLVSAESTEPLLLTLMAVLAMLGVFFIFGVAAGHIRVGARLPAPDIASFVAEGSTEAMQLMRSDGSLVWSNATGSGLLGGAPLSEVSDIETALGGSPAVAEAMFRLMRAAEAGEQHDEMVPAHLASDALGPREEVAWVRLSVSPFAFPEGIAEEEGSLVLWRISDVTAERAMQEWALSKLHTTIAGYDQVPVGLATIQEDGALSHINRTLCEWLGFADQAAALSRGLKLSELVTSDGAELLLAMTRNSDTGAPSCELDLIREDGCLVPVRIIAQPAPGKSVALSSPPSNAKPMNSRRLTQRWPAPASSASSVPRPSALPPSAATAASSAPILPSRA